MGFCFYNNVAVAAKVVMKEKLAKKVLILDWSVPLFMLLSELTGA